MCRNARLMRLPRQDPPASEVAGGRQAYFIMAGKNTIALSTVTVVLFVTLPTALVAVTSAV